MEINARAALMFALEGDWTEAEKHLVVLSADQLNHLADIFAHLEDLADDLADRVAKIDS